MRKQIFKLIYKIIASRLPQSYLKINKISHNLRALCLKNMVESSGENVAVGRKAIFPCNISIGNKSGIGERCEIYGKVSIGNNVLMGPEVIIYTKNHNYKDRKRLILQQGVANEEPVIIKDDVWIGRRVMIMPGVIIGKGAVIAAGAVVTKNVEDYTIIGGVPGTVIGYRI